MNSPLEGKTLIFLGSSVTYGSAAGGVSFADFIAERNGCEIIKEAVPGTTLADENGQSYIPRLRKINCAKADIFVCQLSTNDAFRDSSIGEITEDGDCSFNTETVAGALEYIITYATDKWHCPVVFYTNPEFDSEKYGEMVGLLYRLKEKYGFSVIDMWNDESFAEELREKRETYMADAIHPTKEGYLLQWTPFFEKTLFSL